MTRFTDGQKQDIAQWCTERDMIGSRLDSRAVDDTGSRVMIYGALGYLLALLVIKTGLWIGRLR